MEMEKLCEIVKYVYERECFVITDSYGYGCDGIHCECPYADNGFYFDSEADSEELAVYMSTHDRDYICNRIAETIYEMLHDFDVDEAIMYLCAMLRYCDCENKIDYVEMLNKWLDKYENQEED